jgi:hypothetical protein
LYKWLSHGREYISVEMGSEFPLGESFWVGTKNVAADWMGHEAGVHSIIIVT